MYDTSLEEFEDFELQRSKIIAWIQTFPSIEQERMTAALDIATRMHEGQVRDEGHEPPYIIHPIRAALILKEFGYSDPDNIIAILLHDVVEDTPFPLEDIRTQFGEKVAGLVKALTRPRPINETEEEKRVAKAAKFEWYLTAEKPVQLLKCADLLDNLRSRVFIVPMHKSVAKLSRWFAESDQYYLKIAEQVDVKMADAMRQALQKAHEVWPDVQ